jgi:diketogulonate reductase-like aldo/keto reductase
MDRATCIHALAGLGILSLTPDWLTMQESILQRSIPGTNEKLPVVGLGTWQTFDVGESESEREPLKVVLKTLIEKGGRVIDSSPMYGRSEEVVGDLSTALNLNDKLFIATKVWTNGKENGIKQMNESFSLLKRKTIDLMQIHNLTDWQTHLKTLRDWKDQGKIKYIGITHYTESAYSRILEILKNEPIDFLQINYSLGTREAEQQVLPLAREKNVAVLINRPFEEGALFRAVKGKPLPAVAKEIGCSSWGQFFLKFIISHPAVTCVIPGTDKPHHMADNSGAGFGKLPNEKQRREMILALS